MTIRTDHGFLFGFPGKGRLEVDDMVLDDERRWPIDGIAMLYRAGAPVAVASQTGADLLEASGYVRTSDFYRGETHHPRAE